VEHELDTIQRDALAEIEGLSGEAALEDFRVRYLGKKGRLTAASAALKNLSPEQKPLVGKKLNEARVAITEALESRQAALVAERDAGAVAGIDPTLPGTPAFAGTRHPVSQILDRAVRTLRRLGFALAQGPEIETEWHCFDALNTPADHPARNASDTFYFDDGRLLRTHTSSVQIRTMETTPPPLRIIAPGSAFRRDEIDATHLSAFHQLEGLYVDETVTLADLKGTLEYFLKATFGDSTSVRFRPHFFPFTEPSFEVDLSLNGKWIEIAGCGMVDPAVFEAVSRARGDEAFHPDKVTGFAFGLGLDRLAMILWGITDIRHLIENDARFLRQFG